MSVQRHHMKPVGLNVKWIAFARTQPGLAMTWALQHLINKIQINSKMNKSHFGFRVMSHDMLTKNTLGNDYTASSKCCIVIDRNPLCILPFPISVIDQLQTFQKNHVFNNDSFSDSYFSIAEMWKNFISYHHSHENTLYLRSATFTVYRNVFSTWVSNLKRAISQG